MIENISKAGGNHTIAANVVFHTTGIMLSNDNIANLSGLCNDPEIIDKFKKQNFTEKMINHLKKNFLIIWCYIMMEKISSLIYVKVILECSG